MKRVLAFLLAATLAVAGFAQSNTATLLSAATTTGAGAARDGIPAAKTYQASGATTAGSGASAVAVQCSNNNTNWDTLGTITLTLSSTSSSDSFVSTDRCRYLRGNVISISGTNAAVTLTVGF